MQDNRSKIQPGSVAAVCTVILSIGLATLWLYLGADGRRAFVPACDGWAIVAYDAAAHRLKCVIPFASPADD